MNSFRYFAFGVAGFVAYNNTVILWELGKPNSRVCPKCAVTRVVVGSGLAVVGLVLAFSSRKDS
jgi:hypothetical protein